MASVEALLDKVLRAFVTHVPAQVVAAAALAFYPGIGLLLPLALGWSVPNLIEINVVGATMAMLISVTWLVVQLEAANRRHLVEWTTNLRLLNAEEFEWLVGEVFRREGWQVRETGRQDGPDGNIDLELTKGNERRIVQCKRWTAREVGVDEIRSFAGTLLREGLSGSRGIFVTLSGFNTQAEQEAKTTGIELVDRHDLFLRVERVRRSEPCPECGQPMVFSRSDRGWWFRCVSGGCNGKRDLGMDASRAFEFLAQTPDSPS